MKAAAHVDDGRPFDVVQYVQQFVALVGGLPHDIGQVLPLEGHAEDVEGGWGGRPGISGFSGFSGISGISGFSGISGISG